MYFSPSTTLFYDPAIHAVRPADAVAIDGATFQAMLAARSAGCTIAAGPDGQPVARKPAGPTLDERRAAAIRAVKAEASGRILAVAPIWRQMNDARDLPLSTGADRIAIEQRLATIDAIRAASGQIETTIATMTARTLAQLDITADHHWPS